MKMSRDLLEKLLGDVKQPIHYPSFHFHAAHIPGNRVIENTDSGETWSWTYDRVPFSLSIPEFRETPCGWRTDYLFSGTDWTLLVRTINVHIEERTEFTEDGIMLHSARRHSQLRQIFSGNADRFAEDIVMGMFVL